jgi:hypothetical protein
MTMNDSWGYQRADDNWKSPRQCPQPDHLRARWRQLSVEVGVKSAKMHASGESVAFTQDKFRVKLTGLPEGAPDNPVTTIAIECDDVPMQNTLLVRENKPRDGV